MTTRNIFLFLATFVAGALIALVVRAARFDAHAGERTEHTAGGEYAPMVNNALTPATGDAAKVRGATEPARAGGHENHVPAAPEAAGATTVKTAADAGKPVNTVCAICGMDVDPKLPTAQYQGKTIGFGCKMCPPKFKADPDRWGPLYLKNEVAKRG